MTTFFEIATGAMLDEVQPERGAWAKAQIERAHAPHHFAREAQRILDKRAAKRALLGSYRAPAWLRVMRREVMDLTYDKRQFGNDWQPKVHWLNER